MVIEPTYPHAEEIMNIGLKAKEMEQSDEFIPIDTKPDCKIRVQQPKKGKPSMPFDGKETEFEVEITRDALWYLERGLKRVQNGYCRNYFFRRTLLLRRPKFCAAGALCFSDNGEPESYSIQHESWAPAENEAWMFLKSCIDNTDKSLIQFGTERKSPSTQYRVIELYKMAIEKAKGEIK